MGNFQSENASNLFEKMEIRRLELNLEEQGGRRRVLWMCTLMRNSEGLKTGAKLVLD